ncbi:NAD-dependent succinate-semialdehyde dehydrogenase [Limibacter armeniacum]|uniref:NAD-dependent succinate-semialdehyde dehydrogenase n=1 Tax=Limibacter armeniacum TaxID=466084 RepID=UPI002FE54301
MEFQSINPANGKVIAQYKGLNPAEVKEKISLSEKAFQQWKWTSFTSRATVLKKAAQLLLERKEQYAALITDEMGKLPYEAVAEIEKSALVCNYYADHAEEILQDEVIASRFSRSIVNYSPLGAILEIMPWNFPFWQVFRFSAPALMAGNVLLLKHAPNVFGAAVAIEELLIEAGLPEHVFQNLIIDTDQVEEVLAAPIVQGIALTGSERAGAAVASLAGKHIKKSILELGGSDPFIVLQDADIDIAATAAVQSRMGNAGQACTSAKRFIVAKEILEPFTDAIMDKISNMATQANGKQVAYMARPDLADNLQRQMLSSIEMGAQLLHGGERSGNYFPPTVLTNVSPGMPVFEEETFGPLLCIIEAEDEQDAVRLANSSRYGLGASIWTKDETKGFQLASMVEAGTISVNHIVKSDPRLPFGGTKKSGYGRELSAYGIKEFVNIKTMVVG